MGGTGPLVGPTTALQPIMTKSIEMMVVGVTPTTLQSSPTPSPLKVMSYGEVTSSSTIDPTTLVFTPINKVLNKISVVVHNNHTAATSDTSIHPF